MRHILSASLLSLLLLASPVTAADVSKDIIAGYLESGHLAEGRKAVETVLAAEPKDSALKFQLGLAQFFGALEKLEQDWHRYGMHDSFFGTMIPFLRLPVAPNPNPERITNEAGRAVLAEFIKRLGEVADTLSQVSDDAAMKVTLRPGLVRLDFDGDGVASENEALWTVMTRIMPGMQVRRENAQEFLLKMDLGDVRWLQGYCHLISALGDIALAHDTGKLFQHTAPLFFADADTPFDFLRRRGPNRGSAFGGSTEDILDGIAFIHLLSFPVKEPQRMTSALHHLEEVTKLSRQSWKAILAETDDDHEWLPGPRQNGPFGGSRITDEMINGWFAFLDEVDAILAGKKLLPFWREAGGRGVNLHRVFTEPSTLDVILWIQGTAAAPYLEQGPITSDDFWRTTNRIFRGEFLGFAIWFN